MERKECKIPPNKGIVVILLICVIGCCFLLFNRPDQISRYTPPEALLCLGVWALCLEWKAIVLNENGLSVRYYPSFIKRTISLDRIRNIERVDTKRERYYAISLDACPSFAESKCRDLGLYMLAHPVKVIAIRRFGESIENWETLFEEWASCVKVGGLHEVLENARKPKG